MPYPHLRRRLFARRLLVDLGSEPSEEVQRLLDRPDPAALAWEGPGTSEESLEDPLALAVDPRTNRTRRFTGSQTAAFALLAAAVGIGYIAPGKAVGKR